LTPAKSLRFKFLAPLQRLQNSVKQYYVAALAT
jgi:hypothetical protein